jgi:predicted TPR repeat methyltransferase
MPLKPPSSPGHGSFAAVGPLFDHAAADHRAGRLEQAEAGYREILRKVPKHLRALQNLGAICRATGRRDEALALYQQALTRDPLLDDVRLNLGNLLNDLSRFDEAEEGFRAVLQRRPNDVRALLGLGLALIGQLREEAAAETLRRLVELAPEHRRGLRHLASTLGRLGLIDESTAVYERLLALEPDNAAVRYVVDALRGREVARAPASYVRELFNNHAADFEEKLKGRLAYWTPELLTTLLTRHVPAGTHFAHVLDLGCGTGLMAPLLRPFCGRLEGVDLSPGMIQEAEKKGLYDRLAVADIVEFLGQETTACDLVTAADVFVYLGDLAPVFGGVAARLRKGGLFLFSTEHAGAEDGFRLQANGRYAHGGPYIDRLARQSGFAVVAATVATIRLERAAPVPGGLYLLRREDPHAVAENPDGVRLDDNADEAAALYAELLVAASDQPRALQTLAAINKAQGRPQTAVELYRRALEHAPDDPRLHLTLGRALTQLHDFAGGVRHLRRAAELAPDDAAPLVALGFALFYAGATDEALATARAAARRKPTDSMAWFVLSKILLLVGDVDAAKEALDKARAVGLDQHLAADLDQVIEGRPTGATTLEALRDAYDGVASYYESHVLPGLQNHVWRQLLALLDRQLGPTMRFSAAADLGCGPGLLGEALRPRVERLVGVDLSPAMIAEATKRHSYDELMATDLSTFLRTTAESFDLFVASDVLHYVSDLPALFGALASRTRPGGVALFSTEHSETADLVPIPDFRFRHGRAHVEGAATAAGFVVLAHEVQQIRVEHGAPVAGGLYLLRRPG